MFKRIMALILSVVMLLSLVTITQAENITWEFNESTKVLTIKGSGKMTSAFWNDLIDVKKVKKIIIENGVTSICDEAFVVMTEEGDLKETYDSLTTVTIPDSVTEIGTRAFFWAENLSDVSLPENLKKLGMTAFTGTAITNVTIPKTLTSWDKTAFGMCTSLENVTIEKGLTKIPEYTFYGCESLTNVTIPNSVVSIEGYAFGECTKLEWISIPYGVVSIGEYAIDNCSALKSLTVPPSVKILGDCALNNYSTKEIIFQGKEAQWDSIKKSDTAVNSETHLTFNNESLDFKMEVKGEQVDFYWNEIPNVLSYGLSIFNENGEYVDGTEINEVYGDMSSTHLLEDGKYYARLMLLTADFSGSSEFLYFNVGEGAINETYALTTLKSDIIDGNFYAEAEIVERYDRNENDMYIIAVYDNDQMIDMIYISGNLIGGVPFKFGGILEGTESATLKAFVWDSINGMKELSNVVEK